MDLGWMLHVIRESQVFKPMQTPRSGAREAFYPDNQREMSLCESDLSETQRRFSSRANLGRRALCFTYPLARRKGVKRGR